MKKPKLNKRILLLSLFLLGPSSLFAQYGRYDGITVGANGTVVGSQYVAVCTQPANISTTPCTPLATLYQSSGGGYQSNPVQADQYGNFHFYATPGVYTLQTFGPGVQSPYIQVDQNVLTANAVVIPVASQAGSTADVKFTVACALLPAAGGTLDARGFGGSTQTLSTTSPAFSCGSSTQPVTIQFDPATVFIPGSTSQTVIAVNPNNHVSGLSVNATSLGSYAGTMVTFPGTCTDDVHCRFENFTLTNGSATTNPGTGTAIYMLAANGVNELAYVDIEHGRIEGFQYGVYMTATGPISSVYFINDSRFNDIAIKNAVTCWSMIGNPGDIIGNLAVNSSCQAGTQSTTGLVMTAASGGNMYANQFNAFNIWDYNVGTTVYSLNANTSRNWLLGNTGVSSGTVTNNGSGNNFFTLDSNAFAVVWPTWNSSGDFGIKSAANGHGLVIITPDTQWNIQPHTTATGDLGFTLAGTGTLLRIDGSGNLYVDNGTNIVYRCLTAGTTLPIGSLTINSAACGTSSDTGLRTK